MSDSEDIEAIRVKIASAEDVSGCVVMSERVGRGKELIAHISTSPDAPVPSVKAMFGDGQAPQHVACWDKIPVSAAGEPDNAALGAELIGGSCLGYGLDTPDKRVIAGIWADILHLSALGSGDSFLELGGHSILAIRMLARVNEAFGIRIPIYEFLDDPTIAGIATLAARKQSPTDG
jgi:phosphopantetheine binding protein